MRRSPVGALPRVDALPLIADTDEALIALLRSLARDDWRRHAVGAWSVRDVAAHLLDANLRRISFLRDGHVPSAPEDEIADHAGLVRFLDQLNEAWIRAAARLSGEVITDWLEDTNPRVREAFARLDPDGDAPFPVAWAGQDETACWLDVAREYTEKWHHQQQIRRATNRPGLEERRFVEPLLEILLRALPRAYGASIPSAATSPSLVVRFSDFPGPGYVLRRQGAGWVLCRASGREETTEGDATIVLPSDTAWRFLMKGLSAEEARARANVTGASALTEPFFSAVAVMA